MSARASSKSLSLSKTRLRDESERFKNSTNQTSGVSSRCFRHERITANTFLRRSTGSDSKPGRKRALATCRSIVAATGWLLESKGLIQTSDSNETSAASGNNCRRSRRSPGSNRSAGAARVRIFSTNWSRRISLRTSSTSFPCQD